MTVGAEEHNLLGKGRGLMVCLQVMSKLGTLGCRKSEQPPQKGAQGKGSWARTRALLGWRGEIGQGRGAGPRRGCFSHLGGVSQKIPATLSAEGVHICLGIELLVLGSANFQFQALQAGRRICAKDLVHEHILQQMIKNANT